MTPNPHPAGEIVDQIDPLHAAATEGPWGIAFTGYHGDAEQLDGICLDLTDLPHEGPTFDFRDFTEVDCDLIVALRNRWPEIAALLRRLETAEEICHYFDDPDSEDDGARILYAKWFDAVAGRFPS